MHTQRTGNGPFIVITKRPDRYREEDDVILSRRATATLDDARFAVKQAIGDAAREQFHCLDDPEFGGSVGPLPDGSVIEVKPVTWRDIVEAWCPADFDETCRAATAAQAEDDSEYAQDVVDAFNAKQEGEKGDAA